MSPVVRQVLASKGSHTPHPVGSLHDSTLSTMGRPPRATQRSMPAWKRIHV
jgi:hypothetical protein